MIHSRRIKLTPLKVAFEIVSPILVGDISTITSQIETVFDAPESGGLELRTPSGCGLHMHVTVSDYRSWSLPRLQLLVDHVISNETELESFVDESRHDGEYCHRNSTAPGLNVDGYSPTELIFGCNSAAKLIKLMSRGGNVTSKFWAVNFVKCGYEMEERTVEFRGKEGVRRWGKGS